MCDVHTFKSPICQMGKMEVHNFDKFRQFILSEINSCDFMIAQGNVSKLVENRHFSYLLHSKKAIGNNMQPCF